MADSANKHASRSASTRRKFIRAAQKLYAERSIDAVSLNQVTAAAGQKNRNALQYHFGNRDGLIQAILDSHAELVADIRSDYLRKLEQESLPPAEAAARALVIPLDQYLRDNDEAVYYVRILSQLAATNNALTNPETGSRLQFRSTPQLESLMNKALAHLKADEARQRLFLVVSILFHSIADICRAFTAETAASKHRRRAMLEQLTGAIAALLSGPPRA
jgi:AcrR family transcriptional regulator